MTTSDSLYVGAWQLSGLLVEVRDADNGLVLHLPGVPEGFDTPLEPLEDPGKFRLGPGPYVGVEVVFDEDRAQFGPIEAIRSAHPFVEPPGSGLVLSESRLNEETRLRFAGLERQFIDSASVSWSLEEPLHEFVRWLGRRDRYVFHGSNDREIDVFEPARQSVALHDVTGAGGLEAVYATHDGIWAMFFSIVDRQRASGSIRNGVTTAVNKDGRRQDIYQFSVNRDVLPVRPFTTGALYVLPRDRFERLPLWPGGPETNEWASAEAVSPLFRIDVSPDDFPFLDDIGGHDDAAVLQAFQLLDSLLEAVTDLDETGEGLVLELRWDPALAQSYDEWLALGSEQMPNVTSALTGTGSTRRWHLAGPPALRTSVLRALEQGVST